MAEQIQQRQVAVKLRIADILDGQYIKEEGWTPNYVLAADGRRASRVNLLGAVISAPATDMNYRSITIDDGSRNISVRSFDEADIFQGLNIGDAIFVIGRPRQYGAEIYIMPEIIKKVENNAWIEVRKLELGKAPEAPQKPSAEEQPISLDDIEAIGEESAEEIKAVEEPQTTSGQEQISEPGNEAQKIYSLIKELDSGEGAEFEQVLEKSGSENAEKIISRLLMEGEIFELGKGKLKVLE